jgi:hypothetical protein
MGFSAATGNAAEQADIKNWVSSAGVIIERFPPDVRSISFDDGTAQRSQVKSVSLAFYESTNVGSGALKLLRVTTDANGVSTGASTDVSFVLAAPTASNNRKTWTWTFAPGGSDPSFATEANGSLKDGIYEVVLDHTKVVTDAEAVGSQDYTARFHRLFGDINGTKNVNAGDYNQFRQTFGRPSTDAAYRSAFDFDGNGIVNAFDYNQFRRRFGKSFTYSA